MSSFDFVFLWAKATWTSTAHRVKLSWPSSWLPSPPRHNARRLSPRSLGCRQTLGRCLCHQNDDDFNKKLFYAQLSLKGWDWAETKCPFEQDWHLKGINLWIFLDSDRILYLKYGSSHLFLNKLLWIQMDFVSFYIPKGRWLKYRKDRVLKYLCVFVLLVIFYN